LDAQRGEAPGTRVGTKKEGYESDKQGTFMRNKGVCGSSRSAWCRGSQIHDYIKEDGQRGGGFEKEEKGP